MSEWPLPLHCHSAGFSLPGNKGSSLSLISGLATVSPKVFEERVFAENIIPIIAEASCQETLGHFGAEHHRDFAAFRFDRAQFTQGSFSALRAKSSRDSRSFRNRELEYQPSDCLRPVFKL